jgi:ribosomal protein L11 methylase PrmA
VVDVRLADVLRDELPGADVVVANIELRTVAALLARLRTELVVASGYLTGEAPSAVGWKVVDEMRLEGWAAHVLARQQAH